MLSELRGEAEQIQKGATSKRTQCTVFYAGTFSKISSYRRKEHTHTHTHTDTQTHTHRHTHRHTHTHTELELAKTKDIL